MVQEVSTTGSRIISLEPEDADALRMAGFLEVAPIRVAHQGRWQRRYPQTNRVAQRIAGWWSPVDMTTYFKTTTSPTFTSVPALLIWLAVEESNWTPKRVALTDEAAIDRHQFMQAYGSGNCSCHLGGAPCGSCTHPGNPSNQEEDDNCWEWE